MEVLEEERGLQAPRAPANLSQCSSGRRRSSASNSPEFEFWNLMRNPNSFAESNLLSADELFSDGVILPLDQLHISSSGPETQRPSPKPEADGGVDLLSAADAVGPSLTSSKRWRDIIIFRKNDAKETTGKKNGLAGVKESKKRESKKSANGGGAAKGNAAELNINIWPFSRSRSAGNNNGARPRAAAAGGGGRKVSSAPCSRSNSGGESKARKWPSSPGRMNGGVHLGRASPVWQVRRGGGGSSAASVQNGGEKGPTKKDGGVEVRRKVTSAAGAAGKKVLSLNVPMCMGYSRSHLSCRSNENSAVSVAASSVGSSGGGGVVAGEGGRGSHMFGIRGLFTKKVY